MHKMRTCARSKAHNSAQFRPSYVMLKQFKAGFRRACRGAVENAVAIQISFSEETQFFFTQKSVLLQKDTASHQNQSLRTKIEEHH